MNRIISPHRSTQNGNTVTVAALADPVVYPSPLVTLLKRGYTNVAEVESRGSLLAMPRQGNVYGVKHYFEGERRICSSIGGCVVKPCLITAVFESAERSSTTAGTARVPFSAPDGRYRKHPQDAFFTHVEWDSIDASQDKAVKEICDGLLPLLNDGVEEAMHCVELNDIHLSGRLIYRMLWLEATKPHDDPEPVYYYHNDHLGGTAYLTDQTGQVAQTLAYLPYGEDWVDVTTFMYDTSQIGFYQFNGKEKDPETDYLYYGARYHWPDAWNGWLSPDPLMDDYPSISPYAYCAWNPVNLVDPDGMEFGDYYSTTGQYLGWDGVFDNKVHIMDDRTLLAKDGKGNIEASKVTSLVSTTYETLEATIGVFERTKKNGGSIEESTAVLAGLISRLGEKGYTGADGKPHCNFPSITEGEQGLGVTSIHSHPFTQVGVDGYHDVTPSTDDMGLFSMCNLNIIVGNITEPKTSSNVYPHSTDHVGAAFITPAGTTKMDMRSIEKVVNNRHKATVEHWNQIMKGL